jgi:hypothetical protein
VFRQPLGFCLQSESSSNERGFQIDPGFQPGMELHVSSSNGSCSMVAPRPTGCQISERQRRFKPNFRRTGGVYLSSLSFCPPSLTDDALDPPLWSCSCNALSFARSLSLFLFLSLILSLRLSHAPLTNIQIAFNSIAHGRRFTRDVATSFTTR